MYDKNPIYKVRARVGPCTRETGVQDRIRGKPVYIVRVLCAVRTDDACGPVCTVPCYGTVLCSPAVAHLAVAH